MRIIPSRDRNIDSSHLNHRWPRRQVIIPLIVMLVLVLVSFAPFMVHEKAKAASWNLVWGDEFNGSAGTGVNTANWLYDTGTSYPGGAPNWGTGEVETETTSTNNVYQDGNGHLAISAVRDSNGNWTSGRIETQHTDFAAPAGGEMAVEASIQMPNVTGAAAQGYWPAFWMLGSGFRGNFTNWPIVGEMDVMENVNGTNMEHGTLHCGVDPGGPCNETTGLSGSLACSTTTCQAGFHTYRVEVDRSSSPEEIRWYLDGTEFWHVDSSSMDATTWANAVDHSFFIILNVAMGGVWPGSPSSATQSGAPMLIDYVHVYTKNGTSTPTPTTTTTPIPTTTTTPTPIPTTTTTPTPTPTPTSGSFTQGVTSTNSSSALPWFSPCSWTPGYVILHYIRPGLVQQNVYTTYNSSTTRWEYTVTGMSSGQTLQYWFTYQKGGIQYDTGSYLWTHP